MKHRITPTYVLKTMAITALFNTIIALLLTMLKFGDGHFVYNIIFAQSIGLSIASCMLAIHRWIDFKGTVYNVVLHLGGMVAGSVAGIMIGAVISGLGFSVLISRIGMFFEALLFGLIFGTIISYFFISREKIADSEALIQEERIKRLTNEKALAESKLRLLQAQVEPHFLFNTLSTVISLLETDPKKGQSMLEDLSRYLRASLAQSREPETTIGREMDLIDAYIGIYRIRMGDRLRCRFDVPGTLRSHAFPPMLIQPLVENAIKHGLEPKPDGGDIGICVTLDGTYLKVQVVDNGMGMNKDAGMGLGLSNIKERLHTLFDGNGRLVLEENRPSGLKAIIEVPRADR